MHNERIFLTPFLFSESFIINVWVIFFALVWMLSKIIKKPLQHRESFAKQDRSRQEFFCVTTARRREIDAMRIFFCAQNYTCFITSTCALVYVYERCTWRSQNTGHQPMWLLCYAIDDWLNPSLKAHRIFAFEQLMKA